MFTQNISQKTHQTIRTLKADQRLDRASLRASVKNVIRNDIPTHLHKYLDGITFDLISA